MSKKLSRGKRTRPRKHRANPLMGSYIIPTEHAIKRYQERIRMMNLRKTQNAIIEGVKHSRLIALTKYGDREIRENRGIVFVCEMQGSELYVITVLISEVDLRFVI